MPLDAAVLVPTVGARASFIAAVRGGYVFKFDPATGSKLSQSRFASNVYADSSITYEPVNDKLVVGCWNEWGNWFGSGFVGPGKGIFKINASTLASEYHPLIWPAYQAPAFGGGFTYNLQIDGDADGATSLFSTGGIVYGAVTSRGQSSTAFFSYDPGTNVIRAYDSQPVAQSLRVPLEIVAGKLLVGGGSVGDLNLANYLTDFSSFASLSFLPFSATSTTLQGFCLPPSGNIYCVDRSILLYKVDSALAAAVTFPLGGGNLGAQNCRYNSGDGLIYVPTPESNSVIIFNPSTDTVVATKTGFDSPHDVVFTATKKWAIQHGGVGLKEIVYP